MLTSQGRPNPVEKARPIKVSISIQLGAYRILTLNKEKSVCD